MQISIICDILLLTIWMENKFTVNASGRAVKIYQLLSSPQLGNSECSLPKGIDLRGLKYLCMGSTPPKKKG